MGVLATSYPARRIRAGWIRWRLLFELLRRQNRRTRGSAIRVTPYFASFLCLLCLLCSLFTWLCVLIEFTAMYTGMVVLRGGRVRDGELHADECM